MSKQIILVVGAGQDSQFIQKTIKSLLNQGFEVETKEAAAIAELENEIIMLGKAETELAEELCRLSEALAGKRNELAELGKVSFTEMMAEEADRIIKQIEAEMRQESMMERFENLDSVVHDVHNRAVDFLNEQGPGTKATMNDQIGFTIQALGSALSAPTYSDHAYVALTNAAATIAILMGRMRSGDVTERYYENQARPVAQEG